MGIDNMIVYRYTKFALKESQYLMMASFVMTFQIMGLSICGWKQICFEQYDVFFCLTQSESKRCYL